MSPIVSTSTNVIQLTNITAPYPDGTRGLVNASITLTSGTKTVILGENGAGKSTLFKVLVRLLTETSGTYTFNGEPAPTKGVALRELRQHIGLVFQEPEIQLIENTVFDEVAYGAINAGMSEKDVRHAVIEALKRVDMDMCATKATHHLSGGQRKRVTIADVLVCNPTFLLLDEPTASLDPHHAHDVEMLLDDLARQGCGIVVSTHDVDFALRFADEVAVISEGTILAQDDPINILSRVDLLQQASVIIPTVFGALEAAGYSLESLAQQGNLPRNAVDLAAFITNPHEAISQ